MIACSTPATRTMSSLDWIKSNINPNSLEILPGSFVENSLANATPGITYQFERQGYFCVDPIASQDGKLVFNRTIALRDSWAKLDKSKTRN